MSVSELLSALVVAFLLQCIWELYTHLKNNPFLSTLLSNLQ